MLYLPRQRAQTIAQLIEEFNDSWESFRAKRDHALTRKRTTSADAAILAQMDGLQPGIRVFTATNGPKRLLLTRRLLADARTLYRADPCLDWLHVTIINRPWMTSDERTYIELSAIAREASVILTRMASDWSAAVELQVFANLPHPRGGKLLSPHVHATLWGYDIATNAQRIANAFNTKMDAGTPGAVAVRVQLIRPSWLDLAHVVRYPYMAPDRCKTLYFNPVTGRTNIHESEAGDRFIRYLRMFQILSRVRQRDLMFAGGVGVDLQDAALNGISAHIRRDAAQAGESISMRDVQHFWRELMPRLSWSRFQQPRIIRPAPLPSPPQLGAAPSRIVILPQGDFEL